MSERDPEQIAAGLTEAQRRALLAMRDPDRLYTARELRTNIAVMRSLQDFDRANRDVWPPIALVHKDITEHPKLDYVWGLTDRGLLVQAFAESRDAE